MTLLTQVQIEERMVGMGISRARAQIASAEEGGEASRNPYAATMYREFVEPLKATIESAVLAKGAAQRQAHVKLLKALDPWAVAYIAVRVAINFTFVRGSKDNVSTRLLGYQIGKHVHSELFLAQFDNLSPELYHTLSEDLGRRRSKSLQHRLRVFKIEANRNGVEYVEWPIGAREQVGMWLMDCLIALGMLDMQAPPVGPGKRQELLISPSPAVLDVMERVSKHFELSHPMTGPCVEPPRDWVAFNEGGWHTTGMQRAHPFMVKAHSAAREALRGHEMPKVYKAINALQKTAWCVNTEVLDVVRAVGEFMNSGEILTLRDDGKPKPPSWLAFLEKGEDKTPEQEIEFINWKRSMTEWYTKQKLDSAKQRRYFSATRTAEFYREYPELYFVWFADSRGRLYPYTQGISPQGSDMQKGFLKFANGKALGTASGVRWFLINGANKAGFDNAPLDERVQWVHDHTDIFLTYADAPLDNLGWLDTDNPVQFLAWCLEFKQFCATQNKQAFVSHLPVALDGSCNGLQHYSAMLRDEIGGRAVNLTANVQRADIYKEVATVAAARMAISTSDDQAFRDRWMTHGIDRSLCKRSVMTTPYGVTKRSAVKYVREDYLIPGKAPCFQPSEYYEASNCAMDYIWPAIGEVVVKAREGMDWLRAAGRILGKDAGEDGVILWNTPSGFLASQAYFHQEEHNIRTMLYGHARIKVVTEGSESSADRHATSLPPNFVHGCDAAHLHDTTCVLVDEGLTDIAMIHDDYGTHAADAQFLFDSIRSTFYDMYTRCSPLADFAELHGIVVPLPELGDLDLSEVLRSEHFFS